MPYNRPILSSLILASVFLSGKIWLERHRLSKKFPSSVGAEASQIPVPNLKKYALGFTNALAGLTWVRLLQRAKHDPIPANTTSWEFLKLNEIVSLDRKFTPAYSFGSAYLSIFRRDKEGARLLLERWVKYEPQNWRSNYYLGTHLYSEMGKISEASKYILRASTLDHAPYWLASLGIRLLSETGALTQALQTSLDLYPQTSQPIARERLLLRIRSLRYHLQKNFLESALADFRTTHGRWPQDLAELTHHGRSRGNEFRELASANDIREADQELRDVLGEHFSFGLSANHNRIVSSQDLPDLEKIGIYVPQTVSNNQ